MPSAINTSRISIAHRSALSILRETPVKVWVNPHNPTILGDANLFGELIPGRVFGGGLPSKMTAMNLRKLQSMVLKKMPQEFNTHTSKEEKAKAALLILECHREVQAELKGVRGSLDAPSRKFIAETLDRNGCLTAAYRDYTGALEHLFDELSLRNYEVRFMRNFDFERGPSPLKERYGVSFISPLGYSGSKESKALKAKFDDRKQGVLLALGELIPSKSIGAEGLKKLVDNYFSETSYETLLYEKSNRKSNRHVAEQIKRFYDINDRIVVFGLDSSSNEKGKVIKTKVRIGIEDRHLTKLLGDICLVLRREGIDIEYLAVESLESENKSVCTFSLRKAGDLSPINRAKFEEIKKSILDLTERVLGKRSLIDNIIGPAMIPTSSSHTCGANRLARSIRKIIEAGFSAGYLDSASQYELKVEMCNTFALDGNGSGRGHYSDEAVVAGLLDIPHDSNDLIGAKGRLEQLNADEKGVVLRLPEGKIINVAFTCAAIESTQDKNLHQNTIRFTLKEIRTGSEVEHVFIGESTGGSLIEILKIFGEDCHLQKAYGQEPMRGNTPTYLLLLKEGASRDNVIKNITKKGYQVINSSPGTGNRLVVCLNKRLQGQDLNAPGEEIEKIAEVELIGDPLFSFETEYSDFASLLVLAKKTGKKVSELAIEYEARVKNKTPEEVRAGMATLLGYMFESVQKGLETRGPIFDNGQGWQIEGNAYKVDAIATNFPHFVEDFTEMLNFVFRLKEERELRLIEGRLTLEPTSEDLRQYNHWEFIITDPYLNAIFRRRNAETVLQRKFRGGRIVPTDPFVKDLYHDFADYWRGNPTISNLHTRVAAYAIAANEANARRFRIVAAPTAGACGVLPGILKAMQEHFKYRGDELFSPERLTEALFAAGMVGLLFNDKLKMNGGNAGCQAEIGAAAGMAAAAATELLGGNAEDVMHAVAFALKGLEGLTCTPTGGFVAYPCIVRNGFGAVIALTAATLATNKFKSALTPDAVLEGYIDVSDKMHPSLKETGTGGLASSREGHELGERLKECQACKAGCNS